MMGVWRPGFASCPTGLTRTAEAPNPRNWELIQYESDLFNDTCLIDVRFPNCTNYEGRKIILLRGAIRPLESEPLDPHFEQSGRVIARFEPTRGGWEYALRFQALFKLGD